MTELSREERFESLWGREMTDVERTHSDLRDSGYNGWFNWDAGKPESEAEVQDALEKRWAENEANGLTYTREHGWLREEQER